MPKLWIDNLEVEVPEGATILDAAEELGIDVPTLCHLPGHDPSTSCMCCLVRVGEAKGFVPSCATAAAEGMRVESSSPDVLHARRTSLELLLSDHLGDCMGPCQCICPAGMDIPGMIRQIAAGDLAGAVATVKDHIALPAVLGRICPAPCEKGCRRGAHDDPVAIMLLKRFVADADLASGDPYRPECGPATGKRVAIVGAGPAGLAGAYYLLRAGHACTLLDDHDAPGGMLRQAVSQTKLPWSVLEPEIETIIGLGVELRLKTRVGTDVSLTDLRADFDAVLVAVGELGKSDAKALGLKAAKDRLVADTRTFQLGLPGVFAAGDAIRRRRLTVQAVADGRGAAASIGQFLLGREVTGPRRPFNTRIGKLDEAEVQAFLVGASPSPRMQPDAPEGPLVDRQAGDESARCLHCDCRKPVACKLRTCADLYAAKASRYRGERRRVVIETAHPEVIFEPGKCIDCGLCVQIAAKAGEELGLTFIGRGFDVRVAVPFGEGIPQGLRTTAARCADACPTGALVAKDA